MHFDEKFLEQLISLMGFITNTFDGKKKKKQRKEKKAEYKKKPATLFPT